MPRLRVFIDDTDHILRCERCNKWVCQQCAEITDTQYEIMSHLKSLHWFCKQWEEPALVAVMTDRSIEEKCKAYCDSITSKIITIESKLDEKASQQELADLSTKVETLENSFQKLASDISSTNKKVTLALTEPEEKQKGIKNVIMRGLPENDSNIKAKK